MANTISGQLYYISPIQDIQTKNGNTLQKREVWLTPIYFDRYSGQPTTGKPEESIKVEFGSDRVQQLDSFKVGDQVTISFDLRGRIYQKDGYDNCITSIDGRTINLLKTISSPSVSVEQPTQQPQQQASASAPIMGGYPQGAPMGGVPMMGQQPPYGYQQQGF